MSIRETQFRCVLATSLIVAFGVVGLACGSAPDQTAPPDLEPSGEYQNGVCGRVAGCPVPASSPVPGGDSYQSEFATILNDSATQWAWVSGCSNGQDWLVSELPPGTLTTRSYGSPDYPISVPTGTSLLDVCTRYFNALSAPTVACVGTFNCPNTNVEYDPNCQSCLR